MHCSRNKVVYFNKNSLIFYRSIIIKHSSLKYLSPFVTQMTANTTMKIGLPLHLDKLFDSKNNVVESHSF